MVFIRLISKRKIFKCMTWLQITFSPLLHLSLYHLYVPEKLPILCYILLCMFDDVSVL